MIKMMHHKCRQEFYASSQIKRFLISDNLVPWSTEFRDYNPTQYTCIKGAPWEDPNVDDPIFKPKWNMMDGNINRKSYMGIYNIDAEGYPLNPIGRTGIRGRGILGRWGPNHAADPIITRWKRNHNKSIQLHEITKKPILQFIGIQRRDTLEWAIPGGMVDGDEKISMTLKREFLEEVLNTLEKTEEQIQTLKNSINELFLNGDKIYQGYVDDPRNTDNSWMETCAMNFHDEDNNTVGSLNLEAGDDAVDVRWIDIKHDLNLYASHLQFIELVALKHNAYWE
ncbi:hypothetical protein PV327_004559 [Microctonus hyperodae]|uniref:Nudix hydrolase domain-containing protein n=1 Tax=Microctonus hyperodae TaxID=165561 RepID=A0AA39FCR6_MICHY|nr:hypothetical protein PV327_004559 [Microctonus hyperodae]